MTPVQPPNISTANFVMKADPPNDPIAPDRGFAARLETRRPVTTVPETPQTLLRNSSGDPPRAVASSASPMGIILDTLSNPARSTRPGNKAALVPPVPLRYLSAFMLQSATPRGAGFDERF